MTLWLGVRRAWVMAAVLIVLGSALALAGGRAVVLPTLIGGGSSSFLWGSFMPLGWAAALCLVFEARGAPIEWRPAPRLVRLDLLLLAASTAAVVAVFLALGAHDGPDLSIVAHLLILSGLAVSVTILSNASSGIMAATSLLLVTTSYNPRLRAAEYIRLLQPDGDVRWSMGVGVLLIASAGLLMARPRPGSVNS